MAIHPEVRSTGVFERLVEAMYQVRGSGPAMIAFDVSRRNEIYGFPQAIRDALERHAGPLRAHRLDEQTYFALEAPEPMAA